MKPSSHPRAFAASRFLPRHAGRFGRVAALIAGVVLVAPLVARAGGFEVALDLPIRPKLSLSGTEKILLAPMLIGPKNADERRDSKIDLDREFRRYLQKQIERQTKLRTVPLPEGVRLPSADVSKLREEPEFWKGIAAASGADIVLSGAIDFDVQDRTGYKKEEYLSPIDGRTYYRQVLVEETGFEFDIVLLAIDGRTGAVLLEENLKDFQAKEGRRRDELAGLFENLFALESRILGVFVTRKTKAKRFVFEN